jgi:predicted  nucleic acid-binding Zn-ribbon protein
MVLILIAIIVFGVKAVVKYRADRQPQQEPDVISTQTEQPDADSDSESESVEPAADDNEQWIIDDTENIEETESEEETEEVGASGETEGTDASGQVQLKAQYSVNIRSGAGKDFPVVGGVEEGGIIILLEDEGNGWGYIQRDDLTGYVYLDYFQVIDGADE